MRKMILGCLGVVAMIAMQFAQAEVKAGVFSDCDPCAEVGCDPCDPCGKDSIFCDPCADIDCNKKSRWVFGGLVDAGVYANEYGRKDVYYGNGQGLNQAGNGYDGRFGGYPTTNAITDQTSFVVNQAYLYFGKELSKKGLDFGGKVSVMHGTDAWLLQSEGLETGAGRGEWNTGDYFTALPEAYFEVGYNKLSVKVGKFLTPLGHEGVIANERFFYSASDALAILPDTHSGMLATWTPNKKLSVFGGWVNGYNRFFDDSDDNALLAGFKYQFNKRLYVKYGALIGSKMLIDGADYGWDGYQVDNDYFFQSFIVGYKPGKRWDYTFEWTLRNEKNHVKQDHVIMNNSDALLGASAAAHGAYGINQELLYTLNKKWAFGARLEWSHDIDDADEDKYTFTLGANWKPTKRLTVRPEVRYDKYDGYEYFSNKGGTVHHEDQISGGLSAYLAF